MKNSVLILPVAAILMLFSNSVRSQDNNKEDVRWNQDPSTRIRMVGSYPELPQTDNYVNPNTETRVIRKGNETYVLPPNFRPFPHTATQSEIDAATMRSNPSILWCAWNSYGPSFYGTGYAATTNGGLNWTGNYHTFTPNSGDPGCWVWSNGTSWDGRFGHSVIQGAGHSTNYGSTWTFDMNFPGASSFDKNLSAVDNVTGSPYLGRAYTVWTNFGGSYANRIVASYSTNGGGTWTTAAPVSPAPASGHHCQGCDVEVGPGGVVYVVWAYCLTNGQNSTEDYLGFAKSTNGGVTWLGATNTAVNINGIRTSNLFNGIRANGFPRLDVDKTGGPHNGWIYAVTAEKTVAPATDVADICMERSTDGGTTWNHTRVNQDTPGSGRYQYFPSVVVDPNGGVNVEYYDQRNTTGFLTQTYMSRSVDGGNSWTDIQLSDHNFTPAPIPGLAGGYQGDYITMAYANNNNLYPFWADNSSGVYQCWTVQVSIGPPLGHDIAVGPFLSLPSQLVINNPYNIKTKVQNIGTMNETGIPIKFYIGGTLTNTTNINLNSGAVDSVSNTWTPTSAGTYDLKYVSALTNDSNRTNDTVMTTVTVLPSTPVPGATSICRNGLMVHIPDNTTVVDSMVINIPNALDVVDVNVLIDTVIHTWDSDLSFDLIHGGTTVSLINRRGSSGDNFIHTYLNDSATIPISSGSAPFTGNFRPESPLSAMNGINVNGGWTLSITDHAGGDTGYLKAWCLDLVYYTLVGGIQTVRIPNFYALDQNYPNPFNPTTKITYALPKTGNVNLVVYDILGREVATLVNGVKQAGIHTVNFNASNLASGIYFYKIQAGDFNAVKKMVLVK